MFQILPSHAIDAVKWDNCIHQNNGLIYATTEYLNAMADNWNGIIINEYDAVMPLPWRKKLGIKYCYDVPFIQQLGWLGNNNFINKEEIIEALFSFCRYGDYSFNYTNIGVKNYRGTRQCNNYILDLSVGYDAIQHHYTTDLLSNLKKSGKEIFLYQDGDMEEAISLYKSLYHKRIRHVKENEFKNFHDLCKILAGKNQVIVKKVADKNKETAAIALLLKYEKRLYNIMNSTTANGRKAAANHFLFDKIINEFAGQKLILDFEGSDIAGIKHFYENFGASNQPYYKLHFNKLPFPLKLFK